MRRLLEDSRQYYHLATRSQTPAGKERRATRSIKVQVVRDAWTCGPAVATRRSPAAEDAAVRRRMMGRLSGATPWQTPT